MSFLLPTTKWYFSRKRVVITGGSSGIGRSLAPYCARMGADLLLIGRRVAPLESVIGELEKVRAREDQKFLWMSLDITDWQRVATELTPALDGFRPNVLINNAGVSDARTFMDIDPAEFQETMNVNCYGSAWVTRVALPFLERNRPSHIGFVSSVAALCGVYGYTAYSASKFAQDGFAQSLRAEVRFKRIAVSVIYPPDVDTPMLTRENETKPLETRIISGGTPLSPDRVAASMLNGMALRMFTIIPGFLNFILCLPIRYLPFVTRAYMDLCVLGVWIYNKRPRKP